MSRRLDSSLIGPEVLEESACLRAEFPSVAENRRPCREISAARYGVN